MSQRLARVKALVKTANELDAMGLHKEADAIDQRIMKIADGVQLTDLHPLAWTARTINHLTGVDQGPQPTRTGTQWNPSVPQLPEKTIKLSGMDAGGEQRTIEMKYNEDSFGIDPNSLKIRGGQFSPDQSGQVWSDVGTDIDTQSIVYYINSFSTPDSQTKNLMLEILRNKVPVQQTNPSEMIPSAPPAGSGSSQTTTVSATQIRRGTPGFVFIPGDKKFAYKYPLANVPGAYDVYNVLTGARIGRFRDQAGLQKVMDAFAAQAEAGAIKDLGQKEEGDLASVLSSLKRKLHKKSGR